VIGVRVAAGWLSAGIAAAVVGCALAAESHATAATASAASAHSCEALAPLTQQVLPNVQGKTFTSAIVTFPSAARAVPHRHGRAFVYASMRGW
jgi:quercetin dioxygenase-like cupin family protein